MTDIFISARRGAGAPAEILYGTVTFKPTLAHSRSTSIVLPAPTTFDLVDGEVVATNVQPTPEPVEGQIEWAYEVTFKDRHSKTYSFLVGVPDSTAQVNFTTLPRYFETNPPLFGEGPKGEPGEAATVAVGSVTSGTTAQVNNSGTNTDAVLNFVLPQGPQGPKGDGVSAEYYGPTTPVRLYSDGPSSYPGGVTEGLYNIADTGWPGFGSPTGFVKVVTHRHATYAGASLQFISRYQGARAILVRHALSPDTWGDTFELSSSDLATTTANGLMSSADKGKLDGYMPILPLNSRTGAEGPTSYPDGTSTLVATNNASWGTIPGLPSEGNLLVVTEGYGTTSKRQTVSAHTSSGGALAYRNAVGGSTWGEWQTIATQSWVSDQSGAVTPEDFGAVGDGVTDDSQALREAVYAASTERKRVLLKSDTTYLVGSALNFNDIDVTIESEGTGAVIKAPGQAFNLLTIGATRTSPATSKTLTASMTINTNGWVLNNTTGIEVGMLCAVKSSESWYFEPRPESTDARKSELHRVVAISGNTVWMEDPANDGYNITTETVTLQFFSPIQVRLKNITLRGVLPPYASTTPAKSGLTVVGAYEPLLENVRVESMAYLGVSFQWCYGAKMLGGHVHSANAVPTGYGVSTDGCAHTAVIGTSFFEVRRGVDFSGGNIISRHNLVENCTQMGGGRQSDGQYYGWGPNNSIGIQNYGFGSHGPSDHSIYRNNKTSNCQIPYSLRGGDETIDGATHLGRTRGGFINLISGAGLVVRNVKLLASHTGGKSSGVYDGGGNLNGRRPDVFLQIDVGYNTLEGRIYIENVDAEVQNRFVSMQSGAVPQSFFHVGGVRVIFATAASADAVTVFGHDGPLTAGTFRWTIGPIDYRRDGGTGALTLTRNIDLSGIRIVDYTSSGPTT